MASIAELKEQTYAETPLFLITCEFVSGEVRRWSTHNVSADGLGYEARILQHNLFAIQSESDDGVDGSSKVILVLDNADSLCSQIERGVGWKGTRITVRFLFFDLKNGSAASESMVIFSGTASAPEEITETECRVTFTNRMSLQRLLIPESRIQRRCPWKFPSIAAQRAEGSREGADNKYSPFYRCGYSPDLPGGVGNLNGKEPYSWCDYTRSSCVERGMFDTDGHGNQTRRFGGIEFVPPTTLVRSYGERGFHVSPVLENEGRYNDFVPIIYGTAWYGPPIVFARNDGNLTRMEVLLGMGEIQGVLKVLVDDVEVPEGRNGVNMTATGWYNVVSYGGRRGAFNVDFLDGNGNPAGDPYGSMAFMSLVVPNRINDGKSLPRVQVLLQGLKVPRYSGDGTFLGESFDNNPAWILLDLLRRSGWRIDEINLASFSAAAAYCAEMIPAQDLYGNPIHIPRFQCNLVLRKRRSFAEVVRGIRIGNRLQLRQDSEGRLELRVESTLALQQPEKLPGSNSRESLNGGWPAYEFGDGTFGFSGILRRSDGQPAIRLRARSNADTPNRFSVEFQDALNEYQQDSLSVVDVDDVLRTGQEISVSLNALGLPNANQAARILQLQLDKSIRGATYVEFETSVRGVGLKPGDIITLTYLKEGFQRQPFRIVNMTPGLNYETVQITAQLHDDRWYGDASPTGTGSTCSGRQPGFEVRLPRPLIGDVVGENGEAQFGVAETVEPTYDGQASVQLKVGFIAPVAPGCATVQAPMLSLTPEVSSTGGTLTGGQTLYYAVSAIGPDGSESPLSFTVRAAICAETNTNQVTLTDLSFAPGIKGFHVYRGETPSALFRIASDLPVATKFSDAGLPMQLMAAPDENYDHANFYWRLELQPECMATFWSWDSIGNDDLGMPENGYCGMVVRITKGKGAGQERAVLSNSATRLTVVTKWDIEPGPDSAFVIAESSWHFGVMARTSPAAFDVPNRWGATIHISGRSANVQNKECAYELSPLTRWRIGSSSAKTFDADVPGKPAFGLYGGGQGTLELVGISFEDLSNTRTISSGTLTLYYWPELMGLSGIALAVDIGAGDGFIDLNQAGSAQPGSLVQIDTEVMRVDGVLNDGQRYAVTRGFHGTSIGSHAAHTPVYHLRQKVYIIPFVRDFFGSPASGSFSHSVFLPNVRIASATLAMTNSRGQGPAGELALTQTIERGLRTLSGGQLCMQVQGYLAIQSDATPVLVVDEACSVLDVFATVREAPAGAPVVVQLKQNAQPYCTLTIPAGSKTSNVVDGATLAPLESKAELSLAILSVGQTAAGSPGQDLTVTIRL
jgi:hypothetical protein